MCCKEMPAGVIELSTPECCLKQLSRNFLVSFVCHFYQTLPLGASPNRGLLGPAHDTQRQSMVARSPLRTCVREAQIPNRGYVSNRLAVSRVCNRVWRRRTQAMQMLVHDLTGNTQPVECGADDKVVTLKARLLGV